MSEAEADSDPGLDPLPDSREMGVWVPDAYLSRKAQHAWPAAVVYKLTLTGDPLRLCYRLNRPGEPPQLLNDLSRTTVSVRGGPPINRFYEALDALKVLVAAAIRG